MEHLEEFLEMSAKSFLVIAALLIIGDHFPHLFSFLPRGEVRDVLRERCGVSANIDAWAVCLARKIEEDRERNTLLALSIFQNP